MIEVSQEFTYVATSEEISFGQIEQVLKEYVVFYNNERLHGLLGRITPMEK